MLVRALRAVSASIAAGSSHRVMAVRSVAVDKGADGAQLLELFIAQYREIRRSVAHGAFILKLALPGSGVLVAPGLDEKHQQNVGVLADRQRRLRSHELARLRVPFLGVALLA